MNERICAWCGLWHVYGIGRVRWYGQIRGWILFVLAVQVWAGIGISPCLATPAKIAERAKVETWDETSEHPKIRATSWWQNGSYRTVGWFDTAETVNCGDTKETMDGGRTTRQSDLIPAMLTKLTKGWLNTRNTVAAGSSGTAVDPSLPPPLSVASVPPVEWPLVVLQGFSGMVVAGVTSFLLQTLVDLVVIGPSISAEDLEKSGIISTVVVLAVVPWIVAGTVYGLGRLSNNYRSSFWWALIGAYAGEGLAFGLGLLLNAIDTSDRKNISRLTRFLLDGLLIGIGSVLFYTLFRSSTGSFVRIGSLLRWQDRGLAWGVPLPRLSRSENQETVVSFSVLSGRF